MDLQNRQTHEIPHETQNQQKEFYRQTYESPSNDSKKRYAEEEPSSETSDLRQGNQIPEFGKELKPELLFNKQVIIGFVVVLLLLFGLHLFRQTQKDIINSNLGPVLQDQNGFRQGPQIHQKDDLGQHTHPSQPTMNIEKDDLGQHTHPSQPTMNIEKDDLGQHTHPSQPTMNIEKDELNKSDVKKQKLKQSDRD